MKVVYVSSLASKSKINYILVNSNAKPLQSIQRYHRLLCEGLAENNVEVTALSALPISSSISNKKVWFSKKEQENNVTYEYLPFINLPIIRQLFLLIFAILYVLKEILFSKEKPIFICDILNTTISMVTLFISKLFGCKCIGIVTDLPRDMTQSKTISIKLNEFLQNRYDSYILLTEYMNEVVNKKNKPYILIEGICEKFNSNIKDSSKEDKYIMYAGGLYEKYGLKYLIEGFIKANLKDVKLYIYGSGELEDYIKNLKHDNVIYLGVVPNEQILSSEQNAILLVNPRYSNEEYTKYSFPSKNIEYMSSGTPVLTTKLKGIPSDYYKYVYTIDEENSEGIKNKLKEIFNNLKEAKILGEKAKSFVLSKKNKREQAKKIKKLVKQDKSKEINNSHIMNFYGIFLLAITILLSRNTLIAMNVLNFYISTILIFIFYLPLCIIFYFKEQYKQNHFLIIALLLVFILISILIKQDFQTYNFTILIYIFLSYIYIINFKLKDILKWFCYIMLFISFYSLLFNYIIFPFLLNKFGVSVIKKSNLFFLNSEGLPFFNMFFSFPLVLPHYIRNFGIFTEPAFYQFYIIILLILIFFKNDFLDSKIRYVIGFLIVLALLSTFSTAGYICFILILLAKYHENLSKKIKSLDLRNKFILIISILIIGICSFIFIKNFCTPLYDMLQMIVTKITKPNDSTNTRLYSLYYTFKLFITSPFIGNMFKLILNSNVIITNTNITFFSIFGLIPGIILLILQYRFAQKVTNNNIMNMLIFIIITLSINNHLFIGVQSFWLLILLALKEDET